MGSLDYEWECASTNCKIYETIFLRFIQTNSSTENWRQKQQVYLEHLGRQRWGHTARDHKQINHQQNKTQRQLCKRLAGPFIPFSWSCLVWKRVLLWIWSLGGSQQPFFCVLGHFRHGDKRTNERQPGDPSASLPLTSVRRQSFAIFSTTNLKSRRLYCPFLKQ